MAVKRSVVEAPTEKACGDGAMPDAPVDARGVRGDGSGSTTPHSRAARAGEGSVPDRQLNIRDY